MSEYYPTTDDVDKVIAVLEDWFQSIEKKTSHLRLPDPDYKMYTDEEADKLIRYLDDYFHTEVETHPTYWGDKGIDMPADFYRLKGRARIRFMQDIRRAYERVVK
jgi:hypothetical protein